MAKRKRVPKQAATDKVYWLPQAGKQLLAAMCPADIILYGGARGGGKTDCALGRQIIGAMRWGYKWSGLFVRRRYRDFSALRIRIREMINDGLPAELIGGENQPNELRFFSGGTVKMVSVPKREDLDAFLGHGYTEISIEEATRFSFVEAMIEEFKGCLRSPHGVPCRMFLTTNPGGPGHTQVKARFVTPAPNGGVPLRDSSGEVMIYIPALVTDNRILCEKDPKYLKRLESIKNPALKRMWRYGDWDVVAGAFFEGALGDKNMVEVFRPPMNWPRLMAMDWGSSHPFSIGWYAIASGEFLQTLGFAIPRGAFVRFHEWYGVMRGKDVGTIQPNVGIKLESVRVAEKIKQMEEERAWLRGSGDFIDRVGDPAMFQRHDGPSTAEKMAQMGVVLRKGDNARIAGWDNLRGWFRGRPLEGDLVDELTTGEYSEAMANCVPMFYATSNCEHFWRTVPVVENDDTDVEDIDTDQEDHVCDEVRYAIMSRQRPGEKPGQEDKDKKTPTEKDHEEIEMVHDERDEVWKVDSSEDDGIRFV